MRNINKIFFFLLFLLIVNILYAQKFTISGYIREKATGEDLIGANVYIKELSKGTITNQYGYYSLTLGKGEYTFVVSFIGYSDYTKKIVLNKNIKLNISLKQASIITDEVIISSERSDKNIQSTEMGTIKLPVEKIKVIPAFMGEIDILKTIQLLPGVQSAGEGSTGFYVRGGGPDQNLILLDEAVVYNASHLFGFFSVFNADAVKDINLIKSGMPANYGGRLSSVVDISMKEGNNKKFNVDGGIGIISSRLTIQGPIKKDTCSFIISGRRTYIDVLMKPFVENNLPYFFYDLNAKINYRLSDKDRVFLSGYFGRDVFSMEMQESNMSNSISWGNATTSLRWNHLFSDKLFSNTSLIFTDYSFEFAAKQGSYDMTYYSGIRDWNVKYDFTYLPSIRHNIKFGGNYIFHTFTPDNASAEVSGVELDLGDEIKLYSHDAALYLNDNFDLTEKIKLNAGLRYTFFRQIGPFDRFVLNEIGQIIDTIHYKTNENVKTYNHIEPRLSIRYTINKLSSVKASYTQNYQYIHLAGISTVSLPTDIWVPSSSIVKPQFGTQYSVGYFRNFKQNMFESSVEVYYKELKNQIEFKEGFIPEDNIRNNTDNNFTFGSGKSYGVELFLKKSVGKATGWIGYTLSKTTRIFPEVNQGKEFYAKHDRRHDVSFIAMYVLNNKLTFSLVWVYATGNAITLPVSRYIIEGQIINEYSEKNTFRMSAYHRMDVSATYNFKKRKKYESSLNLSIYNVYNRHNPYFIYFDTVGNINDYEMEITAKQVSLFPILPSISWNFKF